MILTVIKGILLGLDDKMSEPSWSKRNVLLDNFNLSQCSVLDIGCGDKSILNYYSPKEYLGIDKDNRADIIVDFDVDCLELNKTYDIGLILGVLEYLSNPDKLINDYKGNVTRFVIIVLTRHAPKINHKWKRAFNESSFNLFLSKHFNEYTVTKHNRYLIAECIT